MTRHDRRSDADLVRAHVAGDRQALAAMYDRFAPGLYDTAAAMLRDRDAAGDVVQDVFCTAAVKLGQLRDPDRLKPWLYAIARHEIYRRTARRKRSVSLEAVVAESGREPVAAEHAAADGRGHIGAELAAVVRGAAAGLDAEDQLVLELSARQGLSGADLAAALGIDSAPAANKLVFRMRQRLERAVGAYVVTRGSRRRCEELAGVLRGWDGTFDVLWRKRIARHVDDCDTCQETRRSAAVLSLASAAPALALPVGLRPRVLDAVDHLLAGAGGAGRGDSGAGDGGAGNSGADHGGAGHGSSVSGPDGAAADPTIAGDGGGAGAPAGGADAGIGGVPRSGNGPGPTLASSERAQVITQWRADGFPGGGSGRRWLVAVRLAAIAAFVAVALLAALQLREGDPDLPPAFEPPVQSSVGAVVEPTAPTTTSTTLPGATVVVNFTAPPTPAPTTLPPRPTTTRAPAADTPTTVATQNPVHTTSPPRQTTTSTTVLLGVPPRLTIPRDQLVIPFNPVLIPRLTTTTVPAPVIH